MASSQHLRGMQSSILRLRQGQGSTIEHQGQGQEQIQGKYCKPKLQLKSSETAPVWWSLQTFSGVSVNHVTPLTWVCVLLM